GARESVRKQALIIDLDRNGNEAEGPEQIEDAGEAGILDHHAVAGTQLFAQHAFDAVERSAGDGDAACRYAVAAELSSGECDEVATVELFAVEPLPNAQLVRCALQIGKQRPIGIS